MCIFEHTDKCRHTQVESSTALEKLQLTLRLYCPLKHTNTIDHFSISEMIYWAEEKKSPLSDLDRSLIDLMPNFRFIEIFPKLNNSFLSIPAGVFLCVWFIYVC